MALLTTGCFFPLEPLVEGPGGASNVVGGAGGTSTNGGESGAAPIGGGGSGGAGGSLVSPCASGEKLCGNGQCRPNAVEFGCGSSDCEPCAPVQNGVVSCNSDSGACQVERCDLGYADCDGDALDDSGVLAGNGCEYKLGDISSFTTPLQVPFVNDIQLDDGERGDWDGVPAFGYEQLCDNCSDELTPPITADSTIPSTRDLEAYFRVAWNNDVFFVLAEAYDNHLFDGGANVEGAGCGDHSGAACEDGVQVLFDGKNDRIPGSTNGRGEDDRRIFLGLSGQIAAPAQGAPSGVSLVSEKIGGRCYRIEASFDWAFITATQGGAMAPNQFPPKAGQNYGFDIGVNDWDPSIGDPAVIERQSLVFWVNPGNNYENQPGGLGPMTLVDGSDAGVGPQ